MVCSQQIVWSNGAEDSVHRIGVFVYELCVLLKKCRNSLVMAKRIGTDMSGCIVLDLV